MSTKCTTQHRSASGWMKCALHGQAQLPLLMNAADPFAVEGLDKDNMAAAAGVEGLPDTVLTRMAEQGGERVRIAVVDNASTSAFLIGSIARGFGRPRSGWLPARMDDTAEFKAASDERCPDDVLRTILSDSASYSLAALLGVLRHPRVSDQTLVPVASLLLKEESLTEQDWMMLVSVVANPNCPADLIDRCLGAVHPRAWGLLTQFRLAALSNPSTSLATVGHIQRAVSGWHSQGRNAEVERLTWDRMVTHLEDVCGVDIENSDAQEALSDKEWWNLTAASPMVKKALKKHPNVHGASSGVDENDLTVEARLRLERSNCSGRHRTEQAREMCDTCTRVRELSAEYVVELFAQQSLPGLHGDNADYDAIYTYLTDPQCDTDMLAAIVHEGGSYWQEQALANPSCPESALRVAVERGDRDGAVASNPKAPADLLDVIAQRGDALVPLLRNPSCPVSVLRATALSRESNMQHTAIVSPGVTPDLMDELIDTLQDYMLGWVAESPVLSADHVRRLAATNSVHVEQALAENAVTPPRILADLAASSRYLVVKELVGKNKAAPKGVRALGRGEVATWMHRTLGIHEFNEAAREQVLAHDGWWEFTESSQEVLLALTVHPNP